MQVRWHSGELESSRVQQSYVLRDEAVSEPGGAGPDAVVPSARRQQFVWLGWLGSLMILLALMRHRWG